MIQSLLPLNVEIIMKKQRWKRIHAIQMFSYQKRADVFATNEENFTEAVVLRVAYD